MTADNFQYLRDAGWNEDEIARFRGYTEEENPELEEKTALRLMASLKERVEARLAKHLEG